MRSRRTSTRAFVIEEDAITGEHVVRLAIISYDPIGVKLCNALCQTKKFIHKLTTTASIFSARKNPQTGRNRTAGQGSFHAKSTIIHFTFIIYKQTIQSINTRISVALKAVKMFCLGQWFLKWWPAFEPKIHLRNQNGPSDIFKYIFC